MLSGLIWFDSKKLEQMQMLMFVNVQKPATRTVGENIGYERYLGWETYVNDRYNFTLNYPKDALWDAVEECGGMGMSPGPVDVGRKYCSGVDITINEKDSLAFYPGSLHFDLLDKSMNESFDAFVSETMKDAIVRERARRKINGRDAVTIRVDGGGVTLGSISRITGEATFVFLDISPTEVGFFEYTETGDAILKEKIISTFKTIP